MQRIPLHVLSELVQRTCPTTCVSRGGRALVTCSSAFLGKSNSQHMIARAPAVSTRLWSLKLLSKFSVTAHSNQFQQDGQINEVEFNPSIANSISIIGNVGRKPEIKFLESGSKVTNFPVAFTDKRDGDTQWFDVEAWDTLADVAFNSINKGERIAVQGRLKIQDWTDREGKKRKSMRIVASMLNRVKRNPMYESSSAGGQNNAYNGPNTGMVVQQEQQMQQNISGTPTTAEETWMSFFENTSGWYDNRQKKLSGEINPKSPDFKKIEGGRDAPALWIDSKTTPAWVKNELDRLDKLASDIPPF